MKSKKITAAVLAMLMLAMSGCADESSAEDVPATTTTTTTAAAPEESVPDSGDQAEPETSTTTTTTTASETTTTTSSETTTTTTTTTTSATTTTTASLTARSTTSTTMQNIDVSNLGVMPQTITKVNGINVGDINLGARIRVLFPFGGVASVGAHFANMADEYQTKLGSGIRVYTMGIPLAEGFYLPKSYVTSLNDEHECILNIGRNLKYATNIDAYAALYPHIEEYIYSRTDHHWQPLGAYYAAEAFCKEAGVPFTPLSDYTVGVQEKFTGSGFYYTKLQQLKTYPDSFTYYKPKNSYTVTDYNGYFQNGYKSSLFFENAGMGYCTILGSDAKITEIKTDVNNGRVLVMIKDSYGNAMTPFFVGSFEKIYVIDCRRDYTFVNFGTFIKQVGATDVLFGLSLSSCYSDSRINPLRNYF